MGGNAKVASRADMQSPDPLEVAVRAAQKAGAFMLGHLDKLREGDIQQKGASDFVTSVDKGSEEIIIKEISSAFPDHGFLAEEGGTASGKAGPSDSRWIIDPLDGTTNFIHGYPMFCVSIALEQAGQLSLGVVFDPLRDELYSAVKGGGAHCNGRAIKTTEVSKMSDCLLTTGFPFRNRHLFDTYLKAFKSIFLRSSGIRRAGAAALDLAHLAAGRCDGFFEASLSPWDVAAGAIIITEAGGMVSDFGGGGDFLETGNIVAAGCPYVHSELLGEVRSAFSGVLDK